MRALALIAAAAALHGCDFPIDACYSCLESSPEQPVPQAEIAKIGLLPNASKLPAEAAEVFYAEQCGIDCQQTVRFDLPREGALAHLADLSGMSADRFEPVDLSQAPFDPWFDHEWFDLPTQGSAQLLVSNMGIDGPWPVTIIAVDQGETIRVYWQAGTT